MIAAPPFDEGAVNEIDADPLPAVAERLVGASGATTAWTVVNRLAGTVWRPSKPGGSYSRRIPEAPSPLYESFASTVYVLPATKSKLK